MLWEDGGRGVKSREKGTRKNAQSEKGEWRNGQKKLIMKNVN